MYYEEKLINGVLMFRTSPSGDWSQCSIESMSKRVVKLEEYIKRLEMVYLKSIGYKPNERV